jgi:hypothetical protein
MTLRRCRRSLAGFTGRRDIQHLDAMRKTVPGAPCGPLILWAENNGTNPWIVSLFADGMAVSPSGVRRMNRFSSDRLGFSSINLIMNKPKDIKCMMTGQGDGVPGFTCKMQHVLKNLRKLG